ncbi:hypothetical protein DFS34DRAFT_589501 [Phlyctochytrium arcticum]|nr:hypothetical protein DFS34DRAFT_589501 [Phlyctochytrium arcticum]
MGPSDHASGGICGLLLYKKLKQKTIGCSTSSDLPIQTIHPPVTYFTMLPAHYAKMIFGGKKWTAVLLATAVSIGGLYWLKSRLRKTSKPATKCLEKNDLKKIVPTKTITQLTDTTELNIVPAEESLCTAPAADEPEIAPERPSSRNLDADIFVPSGITTAAEPDKPPKERKFVWNPQAPEFVPSWISRASGTASNPLDDYHTNFPLPSSTLPLPRNQRRTHKTSSR